MTTTERYRFITEWFRIHMPDVGSELHYRNAYELLVAVMLSAQCTDKRVNQVTPALLDRFPTPRHLAQAEPEEVYPYIKSVSYPNSKARHLVGMARRLVSDFDGEVPDDLEALQTLPGVGRKTANVVGIIMFHKSVMPVDTHVFRVSDRLGLTTDAKNPWQAEQQLTAGFPPEYLPLAHHWLILHGRYVCVARKPHCEACGLTPWCRYYADRSASASVLRTTSHKTKTADRTDRTESKRPIGTDGSSENPRKDEGHSLVSERKCIADRSSSGASATASVSMTERKRRSRASEHPNRKRSKKNSLES